MSSPSSRRSYYKLSIILDNGIVKGLSETKMKDNPWLLKGLEEFRNDRWFDGFQMIQGALQRAFRFNEPNTAKDIISQAVPSLQAGDHEKLTCDLMRALFNNIRLKYESREWVELIPFSLNELRNAALIDCIQTISNYIISEKVYQNSNFLLHLDNLILEEKYSPSVISDLYFIYSGLLCNKKDFIKCFETLEAWSKDFSSLTPRMRAYLTLAELNAYEIEGCGKYLKEKSGSDDYLELVMRIFNAVENTDQTEFLSAVADYSELINSQDGLLKALCNGIAEIFKPKSGAGLFSSLFGS